MDWIDEGIVLSARKHGESSAIVTALTRDHGRHGGLVRGGAGRKARGVLQSGNRVQLHWRARLAEQLGSYTCELLESHVGSVLDDGDRLAALSAACAVTDAALPEREAHPALYDGLNALMGALGGEQGLAAYVAWEVGLLTELGFGLDLSTCAATGGTEDLTYVSLKSGRAVSAQSGADYADRLLVLPGFLAGTGEATLGDVLAGLRLTAAFLKKHVFIDAGLPSARQRLYHRLETRWDEEMNGL